MFEGTRLNYVVPGYTGHIPKQNQPQNNYQEIKPTNQIPGYAGFVHSIKSENMYAETYGKLTYKIQNNNYYQGQDLPHRMRYSSQFKDTFQDQKRVAIRTAAEVVGVNPSGYAATVQKDQAEQFEKHISTLSAKGWKQRSQSQDFDPLKLGNPLPGYTGTQKRIVAANIFGQTFEHARQSGIRDQECIEHNKRTNYENEKRKQINIQK